MTTSANIELRPTISFGSRRIGPGLPVVVIAEIGINHEGDVEVCAEMVRQAAKTGCDAVKLQTIDPDENYTPDTLSYELFSKARLSRDETARIFDLARSLGLEVFTTCGDDATLDWVDKLEPAVHKISSGLLTHLPLIRYAAGTKRSLLMSTGMGDVEQLDAAIQAARQGGCENLGVFQCTSSYPAAPETLNLRRMVEFGHRYAIPVGFSDHSLGVAASVLAVGAGALMIEKHFSLDCSRPGFDHPISLNPDGLAELTRAVRQAEIMLGSGSLESTEEQRVAARMYQRSIVARQDISEGERIETGMVGFMRTRPECRGLAPAMIGEVLGRKAVRAILRFTALTEADVAE